MIETFAQNIHDVSWGTKGDSGHALGGTKKVTKDGQEAVEVEIPTIPADVDRLWQSMRSDLAKPLPDSKAKRSSGEKQTDRMATYRTNVRRYARCLRLRSELIYLDHRCFWPTLVPTSLWSGSSHRVSSSTPFEISWTLHKTSILTCEACSVSLRMDDIADSIYTSVVICGFSYGLWVHRVLLRKPADFLSLLSLHQFGLVRLGASYCLRPSANTDASHSCCSERGKSFRQVSQPIPKLSGLFEVLNSLLQCHVHDSPTAGPMIVCSSPAWAAGSASGFTSIVYTPKPLLSFF